MIRNWLLILLIYWGSIEAGPTGFSLQSGEAILSPQENGSLVIQSGQNTMVDWESFSIDAQEIVRFEQLNSSSSILNRVVGSSESTLLGSLISNGAVYLVNPNGILIGLESVIETAGFIASTLDFQGDLEKSALNFSGQSVAGVVNRGKIHCAVGDIFLISRQVENSGSLVAPHGRQGLLSSCDVLILPDQAPQTLIRSDELLPREIVEENPYALAIRHSGKSESSNAYFVADAGVCEVSGTVIAQDAVHLLGNEIKLLNGALIDTSSEINGGQVYVNAQRIWFGPEAQIHADALKQGDGGKVVFLSDEATIAYGKITAQGGPEGGNGGFVEISSQGGLIPNALVSTTAPKGTCGVLYFDPCAVTISTGTDAGWMDPDYTFDAATAVINIDNLVTNLASSSVIVNASNGGSASEPSILIANPITWSSGNSLTLEGGTSITTNPGASITCTGSGALFMTGNTITLASSIATSGGDITLNNPLLLADNITISTGGSSGSITLNSTVDNNTVGGPYYNLDLIANDIFFDGAVGSQQILNSLTVTAANTITIGANQYVLSGPMSYNGEVLLTTNVILSNSGSNVTSFQLSPLLTTSILGNFNLTLNAPNTSLSVGGDIQLSGSNGSAGGNFSATGGTAIILNGQLLAQGGDNGTGAGGAGGNVSLISQSGTISVHNINTSGGNQSSGTGGAGGNIAIAPSSAITGDYPEGLIILNEDLSLSGNLNAMAGHGLSASQGGAITLSANRCTTCTASVATITSGFANDLIVYGASFTMGPSESMTILGDIIINCPTITMGDTVSLGELYLLSVRTNLNTHNSYQILNSTGTFYTTPALHFLAGTNYRNTGALNPSGGPLNAQSLNNPDLRSLLTYNGYVLNFDTDPPPAQAIPSTAIALYQLAIADAEFSDMLPTYSLPLSRPYKLKRITRD